MFRRKGNQLNKTTGTRGKGQAKFSWSKIDRQFEALSEETLGYLSELAQIRSKMFDGKTRTAEKAEALEARQWSVKDILEGWHGVAVKF